jgi:hypothetical protein
MGIVGPQTNDDTPGLSEPAMTGRSTMNYSATLTPFMERRKYVRTTPFEHLEPNHLIRKHWFAVACALAALAALLSTQEAHRYIDTVTKLNVMPFPGQGAFAFYRWDGYHRVTP